jgi:two-component system, cell cycle sensor histidine kinase and response regulator CckA
MNRPDAEEADTSIDVVGGPFVGVPDDSGRYAALVQVLDEGVVFQDREGRVVVANDAAARILGVPAEELIGADAGDARFTAMNADGQPIDPDDHPPVIALRTGRPVANALMQVRRPDGIYVWISLNARPVFEHGETDPSGVVISFTDITRQHDVEAQRMESLGRLAGGIAHDFNNLLGVILNYASVIAKRAGSDPRIAEDARRIQEAADHGTDLVRQLLLFSRQEGPVARRFDVRPVVDEMVELVVRPFAPRIEIVVRHADADCAVAADRGQLGQVLLNLLLNARDAIDGNGHIEVTTAKHVRGFGEFSLPAVVIEVIDDGEGMTDEVRARAFEPFFTTKADGSGLGLSAAYGSITGVGGQITIESAPGEGSTVRVILPLDAGRTGG